MKTLMLALLMLVTLNCRADATFDDYARVDFPLRNYSIFFAGCFSIYTPNIYVGLNCAGSTIGPFQDTSEFNNISETVAVTSFDTTQVFTVDQKCQLVQFDQHKDSEGTRSYTIICYDDEIFSDNYEGQP